MIKSKKSITINFYKIICEKGSLFDRNKTLEENFDFYFSKNIKNFGKEYFEEDNSTYEITYLTDKMIDFMGAYFGTFAKYRDNNFPYCSSNKKIEKINTDYIVEETYFLIIPKKEIVVFATKKEIGGIENFSNYLTRKTSLRFDILSIIRRDSLKNFLEKKIEPTFLSIKIPYPVNPKYLKEIKEDEIDFGENLLAIADGTGSKEVRLVLSSPKNPLKNTLNFIENLFNKKNLHFKELKIKMPESSKVIDLLFDSVKSNVSVNNTGKYLDRDEVMKCMKEQYNIHERDILIYSGV